MNDKGPHINKADIERLCAKLDPIKDGDFLVMAGSVPPGIDENVYVMIMKNLNGKKIRICVDGRNELLLDCLSYHPFLIKPNLDELQELFQTKITTERQLIEHMIMLQDQGAQNVLVSLGKDGAYLLSDDRCLYQGHAPSGELISSVGSGDAMLAGFISGLTNSLGNSKIALKTAIAAGSASAFCKGLATKAEIFALLPKVIINIIKL